MRILIRKKENVLYLRGWEYGKPYASTIMFMEVDFPPNIKLIEEGLSDYQLNKLNKGSVIHLQKKHNRFELYSSYLAELQWLKGIDSWTKNGYEGDY